MFPSSFYLRLPCVHTTSWTRRKKRGEIPNKKKKRIFCCFYGIYSRTLVSSGFFGREKCCKNGNDKWSRFSALPFPRAKIVFFITDGISFNFFISFFAAVEYRDIVDRFYPSGWRTSPLCSLPGHQWRHCVLNWGSRERERGKGEELRASLPSGRDPSLPAEERGWWRCRHSGKFFPSIRE